jgi:hypothetical protein
MCFTIPPYGVEQTATKNIPVKKILITSIPEVFFSPYRAMRYKKGETYTSPIEININSREIDKGLHSYRPSFIITLEYMYTKETIYDMYIPIGAKYWENYKEYVSDTLVFASCPAEEKKSIISRIKSWFK